jgi:pimeloyl-ACP methyl ester carboxylesterase
MTSNRTSTKLVPPTGRRPGHLTSRVTIYVLAVAGYHAVAPDLRGYDGSDASAADESYAPSNLAADVGGLLDALGAEQAVLVGHDADPCRSMRRFLYALSGDAPPDLVPRLFKDQAPSGRAEPDELPGWLGERDLDEYARAYARTRFRGPLGVYRNQDRDWHEHPEIGTAGVPQPALFVGGRRDPAVLFGKLEPMEAAVPNLRRIVLLPDCGHWTQQERHGDVNDELLDFLRREP